MIKYKRNRYWFQTFLFGYIVVANPDQNALFLLSPFSLLFLASISFHILSFSCLIFFCLIFLHFILSVSQKKELCVKVSSEKMSCRSPPVAQDSRVVRVWFEMDNVHLDFESIKGTVFTYHPNPMLFKLNREDPAVPIRFKPGGVLAVEVKSFESQSQLFCVFVFYILCILCDFTFIRKILGSTVHEPPFN